jgi:hypothetical protein
MPTAWKTFFSTSWGRFQRRFDNIIEDLEKHGDRIDKDANAYNITEAKAMREQLSVWRQEALTRIAKDEEDQDMRQLRSICTWLKLNEKDQIALFDQIYSDGAMYDGTCSWILNNKKMKSWLKKGAEDRFLWIQGNPGSGKSILLGRVVSFLRSQDSIVMSHFATYSYASSTQYDEVLKSLLLQMARASGTTVAHIYGACVVGKKSPSVPALEKLIEHAATALADDLGPRQSVLIIIDGFDEIELRKQTIFVNLINRIMMANLAKGQNGATLKVAVSCRSLQSIRAFGKKPILSLGDEKPSIGDAIRIYSKQRLNTQAPKFSELGLGAIELDHLTARIAQKADGETLGLGILIGMRC